LIISGFSASSSKNLHCGKQYRQPTSPTAAGCWNESHIVKKPSELACSDGFFWISPVFRGCSQAGIKAKDEIDSFPQQ
jgi:hypothetical protein